MRRGVLGQVTSTVVAVVSVVALGVAMVGFLFDGDTDRRGESDAAAASEVTSAPPDPEPTTSTPARKRAPKAKPTQEPTEPAVPDVYVEVYNMTSISGLASAKAAVLQDAGWQVVGVDNWRGNIPESTVYYPEGMAEAAEQLAAELGITRTRGAVAPMKFDRLTVILASDAA